jgi:hypothetical protein
MLEFHKVWIDQCEAARNIKEAWGTEKALGYLIGEKLMNFMRASDQRPEFAAELPRFIEEIRTIFEPWEMRKYLDGVRRVGPWAHVSTDEQYDYLLAAGAIEEDVVEAAEDVILLDRIRKLLLAS